MIPGHLRIFVVAVFILALPALCWVPADAAAAGIPLVNPALQQRPAEKGGDSTAEQQPAAGKQSEVAAAPAPATVAVHRSLFGALLHSLIGQSDSARKRLRTLADGLPRLLPDLQAVFLKFCPDHTVRGALQNIFWVILFLGCGLAAGEATAMLLRRGYLRLPAGQRKAQGGTLAEKTLAGLITALPTLLGLAVFCLTAYSLHFALFWVDTPPLQLLFLSLLVIIALIRTGAILSAIIFAPGDEELRLLPLSAEMARLVHRLMVWSWGYIVVAFIFAVAVEHLGAAPVTVAMVKVLAGTLLLGLTAAAVILRRRRVRSHILAEAVRQQGAASWVTERLASLWHLLSLLYLFLLWMMMLTTMTASEQPSRGAFVMSFFILPIWLVADRLLQWLVRYALTTMKLEEPAGSQATGAGPEGDGQPPRPIAARIQPAARIALIVVLGFWLASLWGYDLPFLSKLIGVAVDALVIIALALVLWRTISSWIEARIAESMPEIPDDQETHDDEWGPHTAMGRSQTLLPIVRKFVGIILVVVVTMTVLSSLGVDIGPLLAGAGVIGLAVGFGAQKIVSDIFSGFFYLLDDAFRVGEYVTAGSISGTVERITLRNLMLRHHRGMLQIVPHSELGPITNYMRGGIIEKFSLDFPYDADIDKIRKIIKRVGQEMLDDPEFGPNFLRPMKSQGVREITNSVMTIRVKFTAKPGTHFVIRREAFKRITQALNAKGIHYAHRKVIVDLPSTAASPEESAEQEKRVAAAGAAAQRIIQQEEEQLKAEQAQKTAKG